MDFLRGLAPPRDSDRTRAIAIVPSRFAADAPLRENAGRGGRASVADDDSMASVDPEFEFEAMDVPAVTSSSVGRDAAATGKPLAAQPFGVATAANANPMTVATAAAAPPRPGVEVQRDSSPAQRVLAQDSVADFSRDTSLQRPVTEAAASDAVVPRIASEPPPGVPRADVALHRTSSRAAPPREPLSEAAVAQRRIETEQAGARVHVSIGRIEVIAASAPKAPVARRGSGPRQGAVALTDYLRGAKGGRL